MSSFTITLVFPLLILLHSIAFFDIIKLFFLLLTIVLFLLLSRLLPSFSFFLDYCPLSPSFETIALFLLLLRLLLFSFSRDHSTLSPSLETIVLFLLLSTLFLPFPFFKKNRSLFISLMDNEADTSLDFFLFLQNSFSFSLFFLKRVKKDLSDDVKVGLSVSIYLSIYLSNVVCAHLSIYLFNVVCAHLSIYLSIYLSI
ncbi:unnamed protein product [Acanthosepion pharaonis]|uniref:Uncharacterized protein n=1 Tax=Acanthosepion pharaonis TaxID=158019 RepID=A0A812EKH5_ACAPH|nr:unnamed protein product [Sepia pharaonis]